MVKDGKYIVNKDIILKDGFQMFKKGDIIYRTNGVYYGDSGLMPNYYQLYLRTFMKEEAEMGWDYVSPIKETTAFRNDKEDL